MIKGSALIYLLRKNGVYYAYLLLQTHTTMLTLNGALAIKLSKIAIYVDYVGFEQQHLFCSYEAIYVCFI